MLVVCPSCGRTRDYRPSAARHLKTGYCISCVQKLKGTHRKVRCAWCGRELLRKPSQVIRWRRFFCNRAEKGLWVSATQRRGPSDRDKAILELRKTGLTLREIGARVGLSHERVRELLRSSEDA